MEVAKLLPEYVPLIDPQPAQATNTGVGTAASLLVMTPQEIQQNLERWREHNERIHVVV